MPRVVPTRRPILQKPQAPPASPWRTLTTVSFILSLALVACRLLMTESIRSTVDPLAGGVPAPSAPGPATGIFFDLLLVLPALLVLGRRAFDDDYRLTFNWSLAPMGLLALLAALSPVWAADKFAAAVSASHLVAALIFLWSTSQLVQRWVGMKLIAGACLGLLLCLSAVGYHYHVVEMSDLRQMWQKHRDELLIEHGWKPGSYEARLFENRVLRGQPMGFSSSTNTYAALLVLLATISAGIVVQHVADNDHWGWYAVAALAVASVPPLIIWTACRAAYVTPLLSAGILLAVGMWRRQMARHAAALYGAIVAILLLGTALLIRRGAHTGTLWHDSLTFRWHYWVGGFRVMTAGLYHSPREFFHFLFGVGWENFGPYYLGRRLPIASEEIRDPHNFIVRVFVELGLFGGVLLLAWMLRLWWEITRPTRTPDDASVGSSSDSASPEPVASDASAPTLPPRGQTAAMSVILLIASGAVIANVATSIDFSADGWYVFLELAQRGVSVCLLLIGLSLAALRLPAPTVFRRDPQAFAVELDDRPAPWLGYATVAALATFLVHNLIEFSLFEPGPMFLFALLAGASLGVRGAGKRPAVGVRASGRYARPVATASVALATAAWLAAAIFLATPVAVAEQLARSADADASRAINLRPGLDPARAQELFSNATTSMTDAYRRLPWNADYASRAARLEIAAGVGQHDPRRVRQMLDAAVSADPSSVQNLSMRARFDFTVLDDPDAGRHDYERALTLDPNNVRMRLDYARQLKNLADNTRQPDIAQAALLQYARALDMNNLLAPAEIKRLTPQERAEAEKAVSELELLVAGPGESRRSK